MAYGQNSWRGKLEKSVENQVHKYYLENVQLTFAFIYSISYCMCLLTCMLIGKCISSIGKPHQHKFHAPRFQWDAATYAGCARVQEQSCI